MAVHITNTRDWMKVDGRIAKPSFTLEKLRWRGEGEDVYLVGCDSTGSCEGTPGIDCINWDDAPQWALDELEAAGVSLHDAHEDPVDEPVEDDTEEEPMGSALMPFMDDGEGDSECPSDS